MPNREETLYKDFTERLLPIMVWPSHELGTLWLHRQKPVKVKHRPTEAEDNAEGRRVSRIQNRKNLGWLPYAKR